VGKENGGYREFTTPYAGLAQVIRPDGLYASQQRFGMYRWHIADPIRFTRDLRLTIQGASDGWAIRRKGAEYLPLQGRHRKRWAFWYQTLPSAKFPPLPPPDYLRIV